MKICFPYTCLLTSSIESRCQILKTENNALLFEQQREGHQCRAGGNGVRRRSRSQGGVSRESGDTVAEDPQR